MIVLDTNALIWWVSGSPQLTEPAYSAIIDTLESEDGLILISAITAWEVTMLVQEGRLELTMEVDDWLDTVAQIDGVRFIPIDNLVAIAATRLPSVFQGDHADRLIVALARQHNAPVVTADRKIQEYRDVRTIWDLIDPWLAEKAKAPSK